jgi:hypothetical protein
LIFVIVAVFSSSVSVAAPEKIERSVSTEPLTEEQVSVYSFVLKSYATLLKPTYRDMLAKHFYLANETYPLDSQKIELDKKCLHGIELEVAHGDVPTVDRILPNGWLPAQVVLVSGAQCKDAYCSRTEGTLSLSEILFDKSHRYAVVGFGLHCGLLCGYGQTIVLEKVEGHWRQTRRVCGEWYS